MFCILVTTCGTGDFEIYGPLDTRQAAQAYAAQLADAQLAEFKADDPDTPWELDAMDDGNVVSIQVNDDTEVEYAVFTLFAPQPAGGPE